MRGGSASSSVSPREPRSATAHGEATDVKLGGFSAPTQDVSGAAGSARNDTITAWAQGDAGETACPTPGMLMMVALDSFAAAAFAPASDVSVSKVPEMRRETARDGPTHGVRGSRDLPDVATVFVDICPAADTLACHREWIVGKRFPAGRGEILWRRERVVFATA